MYHAQSDVPYDKKKMSSLHKFKHCIKKNVKQFTIRSKLMNKNVMALDEMRILLVLCDRILSVNVKRTVFTLVSMIASFLLVSNG